MKPHFPQNQRDVSENVYVSLWDDKTSETV